MPPPPAQRPTEPAATVTIVCHAQPRSPRTYGALLPVQTIAPQPQPEALATELPGAGLSDEELRGVFLPCSVPTFILGLSGFASQAASHLCFRRTAQTTSTSYRGSWRSGRGGWQRSTPTS